MVRGEVAEDFAQTRSQLFLLSPQAHSIQIDRQLLRVGFEPDDAARYVLNREKLELGGRAGDAEVEVDIETGRIQPIKIVAVNDCGLLVDKLTAESQVNGGVIGALSYVLLEGRVLDGETGLMVNADMENYKVAGALEMPVIEPIMMDMPERGVIGLGEPTTIPTMGALANAVYNAIGVRLRELPMTPDKVLAALGKV